MSSSYIRAPSGCLAHDPLQSFNWLQPPPGTQADLPADSVAAQQRAAQAAAAPRSSQDEANVRSFIGQTGSATLLQGRRLIEVMPSHAAHTRFA